MTDDEQQNASEQVEPHQTNPKLCSYARIYICTYVCMHVPACTMQQVSGKLSFEGGLVQYVVHVFVAGVVAITIFMSRSVAFLHTSSRIL